MQNRELDAAWKYHDATKHSPARLHADRHFLDWSILPLPFKVYPALDPIELPRPYPVSSRPALSVLDDGETAGNSPLDLPQLARLLHLAAGVLRRRSYPGGEVYFRAQACTGNLHHIDLYLICGKLGGLEAGVYHFGPHDFSLRRLRAGDYRTALANAAGEEPSVARAAAVVVCTSTFWRNAWKYRARTYRHCFWDNGTLLANFLAAAAAIDLPARIVLGFVDEQVNRLLGLEVRREVALSLLALGRRASDASPPPPLTPLEPSTLPPSEHEVDYPLIREMHAASSLGSADEVKRWRSPLAPRATTPAANDEIPLAAPIEPPDETIDAVVLRRGSTRRFAREPIGFPVLCEILRSVSRGLNADFLLPRALGTEIYLIANAVDGLAAGSYVFDRDRRSLWRLAAGDFRQHAGHLGLGQALAADAAVDLFWLVDLRPILERFGNRGYRAAQLEAGIAGGRAYLAAFALGIGATGLTFFDDEVTEFFSPHAAGKSVMFLMALGRAARRQHKL